MSFQAQAGVTYEISVDGQAGASGLTVVTIGFTNDSFAGAAVLGGPSAGVTTTNLNATRETERTPDPGSRGGHSVWFSWTAPKSGQFSVSAFSYDFDPLLAVYTGSSVGALTLASSAAGTTINANADSPASTCHVTFTAVAGTTYHITIDGKYGFGHGLEVRAIHGRLGRFSLAGLGRR